MLTHMLSNAVVYTQLLRKKLCWRNKRTRERERERPRKQEHKRTRESYEDDSWGIIAEPAKPYLNPAAALKKFNSFPGI